jgi:protein ImuB
MVSVFLPHWPIERLMRERARLEKPQNDGLKRRPFGLVGSQGQALLLTAVDKRARSMSLVPGLALADARAICPSLLTLPAASDKDRASLRALALWAERFSPSRNTDGEDGLLLDMTGLSHLFGGEQALLQTMRDALLRLGFTAHLALAETIGGAWGLARFSPAPLTLVPQGGVAPALASLPVEGLRLSEETCRLLKRLGLKRIGQLYDLPRESLQRRFASKALAEAVLRRLDQALGRHEEALVPLRPAPPQQATLSLPEPLISHDGVVAGLQRLAEALCESLARAECGARRAELSLARADGTTSRIAIGFSAPCRDPAHLCRLLGEKLDGLDLGFGIDRMDLRAGALEPLPAAQTALTAKPNPTALEPLIDRLSNRLGFGAVRRLGPRESHLPERAQIAHAAFAASPWPREVRAALAAKPRRPALLLTRPEPLQVVAEIPEGPPARFSWRRLSRRVVKAEGPERIAPEWWRLSSPNRTNPLPPCGGTRLHEVQTGGEPQAPTPPSPLGREGAEASDLSPPGRAMPQTRDYYRIEDEDGRRYWVFREGLYQTQIQDGPPAWFLQGLFG